MAVLHPTAAEFTTIIEKEQVVLVDFFAAWCGPCKMIAPILETLSENFAGKVSVLKMDVDEHGELAAKYGVMSIPTILLFQNGELSATEVGARPLAFYEEKLNALLQA